MLIWLLYQPIRIGLFENVPEHWYSECLRACSLLWNRIPFFAKHLGIKTSNSSHSNLPSLNKYFISKGPYGDDHVQKLKRIPRKWPRMAQGHCCYRSFEVTYRSFLDKNLTRSSLLSRDGGTLYISRSCWNIRIASASISFTLHY